MKKLTGKELAEVQEKISHGTLKECHLYHPKNVLAPRGSMKKESLGAAILERLESAYESWTDEKFSDNPDVDVLLENLRKNLIREANSAWQEFVGMDDVKLF